MSESTVPESIVDAQVQRLLDIVESWRKQQCDVLVERARQESRRVIRQAYQSARRNVHEDILVTRRQIGDTLAAARARQHTLMMQQRHAAASSFLDLCWGALADQLQARWQQPEARRAWVAKIVSTATALVPARTWLIEHPGDWPDAEQEALCAQVKTGAAGEIRFRADPGMTAGIRISTDGAIIDGSLQGLMADRNAIDSLTLAKCPDHLILNAG
jgi:vacuolar-type H+-ATPase subunit H